LKANEAIVKRLDALIRLNIEINKPDKKVRLTDAEAARILKSVDFTPTEIAKILGKKSATDVSPYLYQKKNKHEKKDAQDVSPKLDEPSA
jgi:hypothetical protein